jgi:hypothetical protein
MTTEQLSAYKALGFTHVFRTPKGELWGIKLFSGMPVWCKV